MAEFADKIIGGFKVLEDIQAESGSQGAVHKAVCVEDIHHLVPVGTVVALKIMIVQDDNKQQWRKLEKRTAELVRMNHPNVVRYYGCFSESSAFNDVHVIVQEFLEGETLKQRLARYQAGLDVDEGLKIVSDAILGLIYTAERCKIVHRDIKPGNIFLCRGEDGRIAGVKLIDFEIAKQDGGTMTASVGNIRGSFDYMAPDFTDPGFHGDVQSDVFSMGVVLHEVLTGRTPYQRLDGDNKQANFAFLARWATAQGDGGSPIRISSRVRRLLAHADEVLKRALSADRAERYPDFTQFKAGLSGIRHRNLKNGSSTYLLLQFIGKGGFGEVFKARIRQTGELVAIKHLLRNEYAERFHREAKIMRKLSDPCFVKFIDFFSVEANGAHEAFLVMAFLDGMPGSSLRDAIRNAADEGLDKQSVLRAFERYALGLKAMHKAGIFHRDIKPSNLYYPVGHPERAAIMDLGIARDVHGSITSGQVPGTLDYMPPEVVLTDNRGDEGMDIYALGLCLYEALTRKTGYPRLPSGTPGYTAFFERAKSKRPPAFTDASIEADPELKRLLQAMTAPDATRRLKNAVAVAAALRKIRKERFKDLPDSEKKVAQGDEAEDIPPTQPMTGATASTAWVNANKELLERERRRIRRRRKVFRKRIVVLSVSVSILFAIVAGVVAGGYFSWPRIKRFYADYKLNGILADLRDDARHDAALKAADAWKERWEPDDFSSMRLDVATYQAATEKIEVVVREVAERREKSHLTEMIRQMQTALGNNGRTLNVEIFNGLSELELSPTMEKDEDFVQCLVRIREPLAVAIRDRIVDEPVETRKNRLKEASELLSHPLTRRILLASDFKALEDGVSAAKRKCVCRVKNACGATIKVDNLVLEPDASATLAYEDGQSARGIVERDGYKRTNLPHGLDGKVYEIQEEFFTAQPVKVHFPSLETGIKCFFDGKERTSKDVVELRPLSEYECTYVRETYQDQKVTFTVQVNKPMTVPVPGDWVHTAAYMKEQKEKAQAEKMRAEKERAAAAAAKAERIQKLKNVCEALMVDAPATNRQHRLEQAQAQVDQALSDGLLSLEDVSAVKDEIDKRKRWIVGEVLNGCAMDVSVGGTVIPARARGIVKLENGIPKDYGIELPGYERLSLPVDFDGSVFAINERSFSPKPVTVSLPSGLETGVRCLFDGKEVVRPLQLKPGMYSCVYQRSGYRDQPMTFEVEVSMDRALPSPQTWSANPVKVSMPKIEASVTCRVDGQPVSAGEALALDPGEHSCEYERADYQSQSLKFVVVAAVETTVPAPQAWVPTEALKKLNEAEHLLVRGDWEKAQSQLDAAHVVSAENKKRKLDLLERAGQLRSMGILESVERMLVGASLKTDELAAARSKLESVRVVSEAGRTKREELRARIVQLEDQNALMPVKQAIERSDWETAQSRLESARVGSTAGRQERDRLRARIEEKMDSLVVERVKQAMADNNWERAKLLLDEGRTKVVSKGAKQELDELAGRMEKRIRLKKLYDDAYLRSMDLIYYDAIKCFYELCKENYPLTEEDKKKIAETYEAGREDYLNKIRLTEGMIRIGRTPIYNLDKLKEELKQLSDWYRELRQLRPVTKTR